MKEVCFSSIDNTDTLTKQLSAFGESLSAPENNATQMNFSRTMNNSENWIGCGYMKKSTSHMAYENVRFPFYSIVIVIKGSGSYIAQNGSRHKLTPGSVFQRFPETPHSSYVDIGSGWREYYIDCDRGLYTHLCSMGIIDSTTPVFSINMEALFLAKIETYFKRLGTVPQTQLPDLYVEYLSILRCLFSQSIHRENSISGDRMVDIACHDFKTKYKQRFDLKVYCAEKGWGYDSFRKRFKHQLGLSPLEYLVRKRMEIACQLLRSGSKQITVIAAELGYASPYEFSNQFHKHFGIYPKHFRNGTTATIE
ncbi:MAG: AraC family transcriptional regulator of arabinose operon [Psychromonas sp.]|jgi:AraC family transcriptional regulator of arabinose operon|uniref:helix-turn-helix domain-containing protein n=1 Tax=Psychromonas sp. TaxID=1884585 RepID=UPI0039E56883